MFWEPYQLGKSYNRIRHIDCGKDMDMPDHLYPRGAYWACWCGWSAPFEYMCKKGREWYSDHFEGWVEARDDGKLVWVTGEYGMRHTRVVEKRWIGEDGTWEPYDKGN